jgi:hypothetical protein
MDQKSIILSFLLTYVVIHFWVPTKKRENTKKYIKKYSKEIKKIIGVRKGCWNAKKRSKLIEEVQKCKMLKFDSIFLTDESPVDKKKIQVKEEKSKIRCLWTQLNFI